MSKASVLIIEDNRDILETVKAMLERDGYEVIGAEDCSTAFDYLAQNRPDLIITDLMIPEVTGLEFIHQIKRISKIDRIPIIAMSAYDRTYLAAAIGAGAVGALHKPEDLDILVQTVNEILAKHYRGVA
jgi:two-component system, sensor histidine kinase and response regulator